MSYLKYAESELALVPDMFKYSDQDNTNLLLQLVECAANPSRGEWSFVKVLEWYDAKSKYGSGHSQQEKPTGRITDLLLITDFSRGHILLKALNRIMRFSPLSPIDDLPDQWRSYGRPWVQHKREGRVWKNVNTGVAYHYEGNGLCYPGIYLEAGWLVETQPKVISFPFEVPVDTTHFYFTDNTFRIPTTEDYIHTHRKAALIGAVAPVLYPSKLEIIPTAEALVLKHLVEVLVGLGWSEDIKNIYIKDLIRTEQGDMTLSNVDVPEKIRPGLLRALALVPGQMSYSGGGWFTNKSGLTAQLTVDDVYTTDSNYRCWSIIDGFCCLQWRYLSKASEIGSNLPTYVHFVSDQYVQIIAGDQDEWLWHQRQSRGLDHPRPAVATHLTGLFEGNAISPNVAPGDDIQHI